MQDSEWRSRIRKQVTEGGRKGMGEGISWGRCTRRWAGQQSSRVSVPAGIHLLLPRARHSQPVSPAGAPGAEGPRSFLSSTELPQRKGAFKPMTLNSGRLHYIFAWQSRNEMFSSVLVNNNLKQNAIGLSEMEYFFSWNVLQFSTTEKLKCSLRTAHIVCSSIPAFWFASTQKASLKPVLNQKG